MNNDFLKEITLLNTFNELSIKFDKIRKNSKAFYSTPLVGSSKPMFIRSKFYENEHVLVLLPTRIEADEFYVELSILGFDSNLIQIDNFDLEQIQEKLTNIYSKNSVIIISTYELLKIKLPPQKALSKNTTRLEVGSEISYNELIEYLNTLNYENEKIVVDVGNYSVRGSIIDFWSYSEENPCRLEFDGDFLESIRYFDPESQRSSGRVESVTLASSIVNEDTEYSADIFDYIKEPVVFASVIELNELEKSNYNAISQNSSNSDLDEELKNELLEGSSSNVKSEQIVVNPSEITIESLLQKNAFWFLEDPLGHSENRNILNIFSAPLINSNSKLLVNTIKEFSQKGFQIFITSENEIQAKRLFDLLIGFNGEINPLFEKGLVKVKVLAIKEGFLLKDDKKLIFTDYQIFNKPYRSKLSKKQITKRSRVKEFASLKIGDFIVHETFGIGKYEGLETIKIGMTEQETIKILYAEGGKVYLNINYLSLIKKYSSGEKATPKLTNLSSGEWRTAKKKVKSKIKDAARELIQLYALRKSSQGFAFSSDTVWQKELEASFLYEPTPDQFKVTEEVKLDMENENPMDRLVCGDVGFGKTEVAVRAAFKAVNDGKQVGLLVPTTILAEQHYNTFRDRLSQFPLRVEVLSRFATKQRQRQVVEELSKGKVDIVIGTHRLLSKDIKFKDLGLLIIDEEHRFGVMAKEKLRSIKANVDTLTLTATPIPRTLNLSLLGARDLSIIATPPPNRQPIYTKVDTFDIIKIREWILFELNRKGQVYFVHDRVQSIEKIAQYIKKHIPEIRIAVAHGQMKPVELEKVIYQFLNREADVLISTKIIESGIDIPNVNTIIVNRADRFGLAELHQLRGRVGRSDRQAYSYFLVPSLNTITKKAIRRLQAIEESTELGGGFNLAMRDLEIRGAGNLLGTEQSGSIDTVGFDLYVKLLDEAVEELKLSEFKDVFKDLPKHIERSEPTIDTYFEVAIPKSFMPDQSDRLSYYQALFSIIKIEELDEIIEELSDKYGRLPIIIQRLIKTAILRYYASYSQFERVVITRKKISFFLPKEDKEEFYTNNFSKLMEFIVTKHSKDVKFVQGKDFMKLEIDNKYDSPEKVLEFSIEFNKKILNIFDNKIAVAV